MSAPPSLSFRIQAPLRPSSTTSSSRPPSRPTSRPTQNDDGDSSDDDLPSNRDELVTGFDAQGLTKKTKDVVIAPLLIPSLPNLDWRSAASSKGGGGKTKKKREMYVPDNGGRSMAMSGGKKVVGEREVINSTVVVGGLELGVKKEGIVQEMMEMEMEVEVVEEVEVKEEVVRESEEQRALRELMTGAQAPTETPPELDVIMPAAAGDVRGPPLEEGDAFKRDLMSRPDESTLEDYARVPVGQFGLALLRGMGWKVGTTASRSGRAGPVDAFVPSSRPSLLGIGAKPIVEVLGEPAKGKKSAWKSREEERKYVPVVRREREILHIMEGKSTESTPSSSRRPSPPSRRSPPLSPRRERESKPTSDRRDDRRDDQSSSRRDSDRDGGRRREREERDNGRDREREREERGKERERRDERKRERSTSPVRGEYKERRRSRSPRREIHRDSRDRDGYRERERDGERGSSSRRDERRDDGRRRD